MGGRNKQNKQTDRVFILLCRAFSFYQKPSSSSSCRFELAGRLATVKRIDHTCPLAGDISVNPTWSWDWLGRSTRETSSRQRVLNRWRRGRLLRGAEPDPQLRWAAAKGQGDSGCGTWAPSSPESPSPVSAYTPAENMTTCTGMSNLYLF